jgi:hypothetical protein
MECGFTEVCAKYSWPSFDTAIDWSSMSRIRYLSDYENALHSILNDDDLRESAEVYASTVYQEAENSNHESNLAILSTLRYYTLYQQGDPLYS